MGVPVLDELFYRLLLARVKDTGPGNPIEILRRNLAGVISEHAGIIEAAMRRLVSLPGFEITGVDSSDFDRMLANIRAYSLMPRDALHLAIAQRLEIDAIASDDTDFDRAKDFVRYWVINPVST
jgi:predicted nucleic acid-binding protein